MGDAEPNAPAAPAANLGITGLMDGQQVEPSGPFWGRVERREPSAGREAADATEFAGHADHGSASGAASCLASRQVAGGFRLGRFGDGAGSKEFAVGHGGDGTTGNAEALGDVAAGEFSGGEEALDFADEFGLDHGSQGTGGQGTGDRGARKKGPSPEQEFQRRALGIRDGAAGSRRVGLLGYPDVEGQYTQFENICTVLFLATPRAGGGGGGGKQESSRALGGSCQTCLHRVEHGEGG